MKKRGAFSLIEVVLSLGIIAFALVAILGMIPVGLNASRDAVDDTRTSLLMQSVVNKMRSEITETNDATSNRYFGPDANGVASFFYYDSNGIFTDELLKVSYPGDKPQYYTANNANFYRAKATLSTFYQDPGNPFPVSDPRYPPSGSTYELLSVTVELGWPVNTLNGSVIGPAQNARRITYTFYLRKS